MSVKGGIISRNTTDQLGGGIFVKKGNLDIVGGEIHSNHAGFGGGGLVYNAESSVTIDDLVADTYYSLIVTYAPSLNRQGYYCYTLASELSIPSIASGYKATITIGDSSFVISSALSISNELEDEEETCVINNRTIGAIKTTIVAEDRNS
jgi:hypothetical protein